MRTELKHVENRIIVSIDLEAKNWHQFDDGTKIRLERKYENFNERYTRPVNATVISAEHIPAGSEILIHHNCTHDTNRIFNYKQLSGKEEASDIKYYSIHEDEAFAWAVKQKKTDGRYGRNWWYENNWHPLPGFDFALRVFKPYKGILHGVEPEKIKQVLFMLTGKYKGKVCVTLQAVDYQIIFQDMNGREGNLIRLRTDGDENTQREPEVVAIHHEYTDMVDRGKLIVGITKNDARPINQFV